MHRQAGVLAEGPRGQPVVDADRAAERDAPEPERARGLEHVDEPGGVEVVVGLRRHAPRRRRHQGSRTNPAALGGDHQRRFIDYRDIELAY